MWLSHITAIASALGTDSLESDDNVHHAISHSNIHQKHSGWNASLHWTDAASVIQQSTWQIANLLCWYFHNLQVQGTMGELPIWLPVLTNQVELDHDPEMTETLTDMDSILK